ncbi:MAG TPA: choice-of-anchor P family protein [Mycobacteriales bacterium]|jgi:hypothetical protein|nr:choice-of-anchor P family protein [Mycobacteriales bacterium]
MSTYRNRSVLITGVIAVGAIGAITASTVTAAIPASKAQTSHFAFTGDAFGSRTQASTEVASGRSALLTLKCTMKTGVHESNQTDGATNSELGHVGSVTTTTSSRPAGKSPAASVTTATIHGMNLLGGVIKATAVRATSVVTTTGKRTGTTTFTGLTIAGHKEAYSPKPNQTYQIPEVGKIELNAQKATHVNGSTGLIVNGLELTMGASNLGGLPTKTQVVLAHAKSGVEPVGLRTLHGSGYGSAVMNNNVVTSGRTFYQPLPCQGTQGKTRRNTGGAIQQAAVLSSGTVASTATGNHTATSDVGTTTSTVHNVSLIGGVVSASAIEAVARVTDRSGKITTGEQGSKFVGLTVDGKKMPNNVKPNTKISLGPLGTLWLNRVIRTSSGRTIAIHMIDLHLNKPEGGVAKGADVVVANADVGVRH